MIGRLAEGVLNRAVRFAVEQEHEYFTVEHVLWSLLGEVTVMEVITACGGDTEMLRSELETYLGQEVPKGSSAPQGSGANSPVGTSAGGSEDSSHPVATLGVQRLVQRALFHVQSAGKTEILPVDLLVAIFQAKESQALYLLSKQGLERLEVLEYVSHGIQKNEDSGDTVDGESSAEPEARASESRKSASHAGSQSRNSGTAKEDPLVLYTQDLNRKAMEGVLDPLIGRQTEIDRMIQVLCRRRKNNPLLVGEAGVGKTAIAEGLVSRIVEGKVPLILKSAVVYSLDLGALVAGAKFRGDFEQRLKQVLAALRKKKDRGIEPILLIDEIHTIIGAGAVSGGALDGANLLKPVLTQGEIRCIGSTTYRDFRGVFEKDHALSRRFQKIEICEPSCEEAIQVLNGLKSRFEEHHGVKYSSEAIRTAVELSLKHLTDRFLPDKAIDVIDEAGAKARLHETEKSSSGTGDAPRTLGVAEIEEVIAQIARIPARTVSVSQKDRLKTLDRDLRLTLFGQDHAIEVVVTAIRLARSGLRSGDRPVGSFLFCGPTGVGKTELSKQLAQCLGVPFLRFDMSEYSEKYTISRLVGAPPGYVGFEQAGLLTDAALKHPHAVILLDEIEKAHPEIWNILLQVMDHGSLTDNNGRKADFRQSILLMTSNVGSRELERKTLGITPAAVTGGTEARRAVEQTFSPEFRNRLDAVVHFNPLDPVTVGQVVGKCLLELEAQLLAKGVDLEVSPAAREWLAEKGYDRTMGARPLGRLIQEKVKKPLAEEILFGKLEGGGRVRVDFRDGELILDMENLGTETGGAAPVGGDALEKAEGTERGISEGRSESVPAAT